MKLNIQLFASGSKIFDADSYLQGKIEWSAVGNITTNKSPVVAKLYARRTNSSETKGKSWNGFITIDGSKSSFSSLDKSTAVSNNWVLMHTYTKEVEHNSDGTKTITISGSITGPSGTSLSDNTSKGSFTVALDDLHRVPSDVTYTMIETNEKLIDVGINDNIFVKDLSIKNFNISGTLYDDASIKKYAIFNRLNVFSTTTLPVIVDLTQNELQTDITYVSKIPIRAQIVDTFETAGYSTNDLYEYIQYNKIKLAEISTTAKRNGQISGKVKLNVNGNLYNGVIGNVDQSTFKPIVRYKFWQTGTEEPLTYDYEIPSDNITIENGVFNVSNYEIGSSVETDINWFNPENAYKVKVFVEDNFTTYESQEKSIPVGEATWTEYKDRVDFKNITTKGAKVTSSIVSPNEPTNGEEVWIQSRENLFNKSTITTDTFVDVDGVIITDSTVWNLSDYIAIEPNVEYTYRGVETIGTKPYFCFYDANKNFVSSIKQASGINTITIPDGVFYIRCSVFDGDLNTFRFEKCTSDEVVDKTIYIKKTDGSYEKFYSEDILNYKEGDKYKIPPNAYANVGGCMTASKGQIRFGIFVPKSLKNIKSITVNYAKLTIRNTAGSYIISELDVTSKLAVDNEGENLIYFSYQPGSSMAGTNNTPVAVEINGLELTFYE